MPKQAITLTSQFHEPEPPRDYQAEALRIILQERTEEHPMLPMPQLEHLLAIWRLIPASDRAKILFPERS